MSQQQPTATHKFTQQITENKNIETTHSYYDQMQKDNMEKHVSCRMRVKAHANIHK